MKTYKVLVPSFILLVFLLSFLGISDAEASDLCWEVTAPDGTKKGTVRLGFLPIGDNHFLLSGRGDNPVDGSITILYGNAEIEGNNILMTIVGSGKDTTRMWTRIQHWVLDRFSLNGTREIIGHDHKYSAQPFISGDIFIDSDTRYFTNTLTKIPCP